MRCCTFGLGGYSIASQDYSAVINTLSNSGDLIQQSFISVSHITCPPWIIREVEKETPYSHLGLKLKDALSYGKLLITLTVVVSPGGSYTFLSCFGHDDKCHFYL